MYSSPNINKRHVRHIFFGAKHGHSACAIPRPAFNLTPASAFNLACPSESVTNNNSRVGRVAGHY